MTPKKPKLGAFRPSGIKAPKVAVDPSSNMQRKPAWRVTRIQMADPYGWHELDLKSVVEIRSKLSHFETMTWNEIFTINGDRNHPIPVGKLRCPKAKGWMDDNMPDQDTLWTLRLSGAERIWGIFSEGVYQIVFWDPQHRIYPTRL